jgi:asparagine synthase (glutamine-hydrolysing)
MPHLPGMFAFALWDDGNKSLFCARDRFGEKPLFFAFGRNGEFILASEIKALLASGLIEPVLSRRAISHYLQKLYVHPHETIYENIHTLPPAHMLEYSGGRLTVTRYWSLPNPGEAIEFGEAVERFRELLHQSVERQLVADVPVGVFLSGGLDSSSIVATATKIQPGIKSFSFGFDGVESELPFARAVAQRHTTHHIELTEHGVDVAELLLRMQEVYDEPFAK